MSPLLDGRQKHSSARPLIAHIDADAFFASVEQGFNPLLRGKPVIVGGTAKQRGVVHTASYEARAQGVHTGMPLAEAQRICPDAVFLKGNYQHYQAVSRALQEIYLRYTPAVEFTSLDDAYLDLTGTLHLYPSAQEAGRRIQQEVQETLHISVSIGIAANKLLARIASGLHKPCGLAYVPPGTEAAFLHPLPVEKIPGIGRVAKEKLAEIGVFRIGQLAALPRLLLGELFGANGEKMWAFARGEDYRQVKQRILPKQISRETTFEEDLTDRSIVVGTLQYLSERIAARLRREKQVCGQIQIKIRYSDFTSHKASQTLPHAVNSAAEIFAAVQAALTRIPFRRLRIRHVGIQAGKIEWDQWQLQFLDENKRLELLNEAVDEIRHKFGFTAILPADTLELRRRYRLEKNGYVLHSPALTK